MWALGLRYPVLIASSCLAPGLNPNRRVACIIESGMGDGLDDLVWIQSPKLYCVIMELALGVEPCSLDCQAPRALQALRVSSLDSEFGLFELTQALPSPKTPSGWESRALSLNLKLNVPQYRKLKARQNLKS